MIEDSLLKSNFIGRDGFRWWTGQVAPEEAQGDQINGAGWGNRVKVRIMGYHPHSIVELPDEDLPWAQAMLGTTDGSGKGNRANSVALSPGDNVVGFFLDGDDAQQPIIMGVLGNTVYSPSSEYAGPFKPFTGFTSKVTNDGGNIVNSEANEMNTKSQKSPQHVSETLLKELPDDVRTPSKAIGQTIVAASTDPSSTMKKINSEVGNLVSELKGITSGAADALGAVSGKVDSLVGNVTDKISGLSTGIIGNMLGNLYGGGLSDALNGGVNKLYKSVYATVFAATKSKSAAKQAGTNAQKAMIGPVGAIQEALPCIAGKIMGTIGKAIKSLLDGIVNNVKNFVSCIADQFMGGLMNHIIGGITGALGPLMGGVGKILGGFSLGGFLRSKAEGLMGLVNAVTCDTVKPTYNAKTAEWTIGKGAKNSISIAVDEILKVANAADGLVESLVSGAQKLSVATGSLGVFDFLNPSVSNPGFKSGLGECYAGPPLNCAGIKINIFGGGGTQALGEAIIGDLVGDGAEAVGSLIGIDLVSGGSGYITPPYVEITDKCNKGYGAVARAVVDQDETSPTYQQVTDIYVVSVGENYPVPDNNTDVDSTEYVIDHVIPVNPGIKYDPDDEVIDDDGNKYTVYVDTEGRIVNVIPPDGTLTTTKKITDLPNLKIKSKTGYGAILKPQLKPRPEYQGEVKQVIDCIG
tara:strand:- start:3968 stop:6046 length:2079 start_codon:yes stop_codon:yes gene_type:complete